MTISMAMNQNFVFSSGLSPFWYRDFDFRSIHVLEFLPIPRTNIGVFSTCFRLSSTVYSKRHRTKNWNFPLRVSSVNVTKFEVSCGFSHIYWRNPQWKTSIFVQWELHWLDAVIRHSSSSEVIVSSKSSKYPYYIFQGWILDFFPRFHYPRSSLQSIKTFSSVWSLYTRLKSWYNLLQ